MFQASLSGCTSSLPSADEGYSAKLPPLLAAAQQSLKRSDYHTLQASNQGAGRATGTKVT